MKIYIYICIDENIYIEMIYIYIYFYLNAFKSFVYHASALRVLQNVSLLKTGTPQPLRCCPLTWELLSGYEAWESFGVLPLLSFA